MKCKDHSKRWLNLILGNELRCFSWSALGATPSARTGCHPLICHLAQLSPPQSVSFFSQTVPVASSSGPLGPLCALYLKLNKLSCNDLFMYLSLPRGDKLPGARECVLIIFIHLSPWFNASLNPFPNFSALLQCLPLSWHKLQTSLVFLASERTLCSPEQAGLSLPSLHR